MAETKIREALELLDGGRNWRQARAHPGHCVLTALNRLRPARLHRDVAALEHVISEHYAQCVVHNGVAVGVNVISFNDHPDTTFADVERVMEKAAIMREEAVE